MIFACDSASTERKAPTATPRENREALAKVVEAKATQIGVSTTREEHGHLLMVIGHDTSGKHCDDLQSATRAIPKPARCLIVRCVDSSDDQRTWIASEDGRWLEIAESSKLHCGDY